MKKVLFRRTAMIMIIIVSFVFVIGGCGGAGKEDANPSTPSSQTDGKVTPEPEGKVEVKEVRITIDALTDNIETVHKELFDKFMEDNPDIKINLDVIPSEQYGNAIELSYASDAPPDIFRAYDIPGVSKVTLTSSVERGWLNPIDEFVTDEFKARFKPEVFSHSSGLYINQKLYSFPLESVGPSRVLYYNTDILKQFGFDGPPETWGELKDMAVKITNEGKGDVYGFSIIGKNIILLVTALQNTAGVPTSETIPINLTTFEAAASDPSRVATIDFIKELASSKVLAPGWENWNGPLTFQQFAAGKFAMYIGASWHPTEIRKLNPDLNFEMAPIPYPDSGRKGYVTTYGQLPSYVMSSKTKNPEATWRVLDYCASAEFQKRWIDEGLIVANQGAYDGVELSKDTLQRIEVEKVNRRSGPNSSSNHVDGDKLISNIVFNAPKPTHIDLYLQAIIGNKNYRTMAEEYDRSLQEVIEAQLAEIKKSGSTITREDVTFSDWNPLEDYIPKK